MASSDQKKKTKRSKTKYPGLVKEVNPKTRWEYLDQDYIDKLSPKEKEWLSNFNEEYLSGNFKHPGKKLHKTTKERRECYTRNNARNRDLYTINRTKGWVQELNPETVDSAKIANPAGQEDALIDLLDLKKKVNKS